MLLIFTYLQSIASLVGVGVLCGYLSLVTTLIAVACSQLEKLKEVLLDIRQQEINPQHRQEDEQDHTIANCDLQAKLNACIRHHQNIIE
jgi:ABC-type lipoprotein release transport system permease subunit